MATEQNMDREPNNKLTENIRQMITRHKQEIASLQINCKHKEITAWQEMRDKKTGKTAGMFKACIGCGKIIQRSHVILPVMQLNLQEKRRGM